MSVIFKELEPSLLSYSGASTNIVVKVHSFHLKLFSKDFFKGWIGLKKTFLFVTYPILPFDLT